MKWPPLTALAMLLAAGCSRPNGAPAPAAPEPAATFVGRQACAGCHAAEVKAFTGSHHDRAMEEATDSTVLGAFDGRTFTHFGVTSTFFRRNDRFVVRTEGPAGQLADFEVAYIFGVHPLQQYLVAFPGGRYQVLPLCWDARPAAEGGQRWFHLYAGEKVAAGDPLHWTGPHQTWNSMCAECHSTNLVKGYRPAEDRYQTTWSEIDVSCEACHGPASRHVAWAEGGEPRVAMDAAGMGLLVPLRDPGRSSWTIDATTGNGIRTAPRPATAELATCGRCHSRRTPIAAAVSPGAPLLDSHRPVLLDEVLYHADGQIDDEVYELGSFLQSKMHAAGVSCSDCHDPHTATLRRPLASVCLTCHSAAKYDAPSHHCHRQGGAGSQCVDCHMPEKTYMGIDRRRDHSLRVPRPDLSVSLGTPNACNACHKDRSARWAASEIERRFGPPRQGHYGEVIAAVRAGKPGADAGLAKLAADPQAPAIVRATALSLLGRRPADPSSVRPEVSRALADTDPLVRLGALRALEALPPAARLAEAAPLLADPVLAVRIEAVRLLAPAVGGGSPEPPAFSAALAEARAAEEVNAERPEAQVNLAGLALETGDPASAETALQKALRLDPRFAPAAVNLADLLRRTGRDAEGEAILARALAASPGDASLHHALGLLLVRLGRHGEALPDLAAAARLAPDVPRYAYVYGVALDSAGRKREALAVLAEAARRHPDDRDLAEALAALGASASSPEK